MVFADELRNLDFCWKKSLKLLILIAIIACFTNLLGFGAIQFKASNFAYYWAIVALLIVFAALLEGELKHKKLSEPLMLFGVAFLISNHLNVSMINTVWHGFLPFLMIYIAFNCTFAEKLLASFYLRLLNMAIIVALILIFSVASHFALNKIYPNNAIMMLVLLLLACYVAMIFYANLVDGNDYYQYLPLILLLCLVFAENISLEIAVFWAISLLIIIIVTADALKSSFMQRKRLKKPKIATELLEGATTLRNCIIIATARIAFSTYYAAIIWLIFEALNGANAWGSLNWQGQPVALKIALCFAPIVFLPAQTPLFWRYFLSINLYEMLQINVNFPPIKIDLLIFATCALTIKKPWQAEYIVIISLPLLIYFNNELILLGVNNFEHAALAVITSSVATIAMVACARKQWLAENTKIESLALGFVAIILLVPDLFMSFASNQAFNYLPINLKMAAKYVVYFPVLCMFLIVYFRQRKRRQNNAEG